MEVLLIAHLLGDFYFQSNKMADLKKKSNVVLIKHSIIYALFVLVLSLLAYGRILESIILTTIIGLSHYGMDWLKSKLEIKYPNSKLIYFFVDQGVHLFVLWFCAFNFDVFVPFYYLDVPFSISDMLQMIAAVLVCGKPASIIIAMFFQYIPKTIEDSLPQVDEVRSQENVRIGSWIGILEREIILILASLGQYGAIGFVLTAKSIARHKQLNEPAFAEKYLLGTLLSSCIALVCSVLCTIF